AGEHQMVQLGWTGDNGDPDNFLYTLLGCAAAAPGGGNVAKWCNKDFDALVTEAQRTTEIAKRTELYKKAQVIFKEEAPWYTIAHAVQVAPMRKEVEGYTLSPLGAHDFTHVYFK
ncbi:MAG TPA: ABC transporter substrate-binding protein, partial [Alphaproteobacteria bacterium]|nr:ABC transporter substrate-binding protein [Alphaproteobacteria bacterium]